MTAVLGKSTYILCSEVKWPFFFTEHHFYLEEEWHTGYLARQEKQWTLSIANDKIQALIKIRILETLYHIPMYRIHVFQYLDLSRICRQVDTNKCDFLI